MAQARSARKRYPKSMRFLRLLLAVLTLVPCASAANVRAVPRAVARAAGATPVPTQAGLKLSPQTAISAPAFTAANLAPAADSPEAAPTPAPEAADAPSTPKTSARALLRRIGTPSADEAAARLGQVFDGKGQARASDGSLFEVQPDAASPGAIRIVLVSPAPRAAKRPVEGTDGLSGRALLEALTRITREGHRTRDYESASNFLFSSLDNIEIGGVRGVVDAYSGVFVPGTSSEGRDYPEPGDRNHDGHTDEGMNVEHVWPQGHFDKRLPMRSDLHHLLTTFIHPNAVRANLPFGIVRGRPTYSNDAGTKSDGIVFEPADFSKGRVARRMLYFFARYRGKRIFSDPMGEAWWEKQIDTLLDWNRRFPPRTDEMERNDNAERYQGNRNPFTDDPALADRVGREAWRPAPPPDKNGRGPAFRRPGRFSGRRH